MYKKFFQAFFLIHTLLFFSVLLIAFFFRVWHISENPPGFFADEASTGLNAYAILKTGHDIWGKQFPIFFRSMGEYKSPLPVYSAIPFIWMFGLNEVGVRMTSVALSLITGISFYFLGKQTHDKALGLLLMGVFLLSPWAIHAGRIHWDGQFNLLLFLILGTMAWIQYIKCKNKKWLLFAGFLFGIGVYSYFPARIIIPLYFLILLFYILFIKRNIKSFTDILLSGIFFSLILTPLILHMLSGEGLERWRQVSVFVRDINPWKKVITSYIMHWSPDFLFIKGDINMPGQIINRHSISGVGEFYIWQIVFFVFGFVLLLKEKNLLRIPFIALFLLYPIPSSITSDVSPQATRAIVGIIPISIAVAYGIYKSYLFIKKYSIIRRSFIYFLFLLLVLFWLFYFFILLKEYPLYSADFWGWQYGPKEIISYFKVNKEQYDEMYMTAYFNAPKTLMRFYDYDRQCKNCYIGGISKKKKGSRQLFAIRVQEMGLYESENFKIVKTIYYPNSTPAFYIGYFIDK